MSHTQGKLTVSDDGRRAHPFLKGADQSPVASCGGNEPGYGSYAPESNSRRFANARRLKSCWNFFESDDGRAIDTDKIEPGGFWEVIDFLQWIVRYHGVGTESARKAQRLLDAFRGTWK